MRKFTLLMALSSILMFGLAQHGAAAQSDVQFVFFACETQAIIELSGNMDPGYDIFYQVFDGADGTGNALTALRQVSVNGSYAVSAVAPYNDGATVGFLQIASAYIAIARESDPSSTAYETTVNDGQDGCVEPSNPVASVTANQQTNTGTVEHSNILRPDGGWLNSYTVFDPSKEPVVQLGARPSQVAADQIQNRSDTPGLIFAECDNYPGADPGTIFDTDHVEVFWSWYAKTAAEVRDHIAHAQYVIKLDGQPFPIVHRSPVVRHGVNYFVFYTVDLGSGWWPGNYSISFDLTWDAKITDGYNDYGPGTANDHTYSSCQFSINANPWGVKVNHQNPTTPLTSY